MRPPIHSRLRTPRLTYDRRPRAPSGKMGQKRKDDRLMNAAAATGELVPPKRISVNGRPIRLRWLQQVIWSFLAANVGALIIAGLYYLVIQVRWHIGSHTYL